MNDASNASGARMEKCPVHDDRNPSLSVNAEGKAVCLAGCRQEDVDAARAVAR